MFVIETPFLDLDRIYNSQQNILRWIKVRDKKYVLIYQDKAVKVEQQKGRLMFNCTDEEFYATWFHHLDLGYDYMKINYFIRNLDPTLKSLATRSATVRIINQDKFETIISAIIATSYPVKLHRDVVTTLCLIAGVKHKQAMREMGVVEWYEYPTAEMIIAKESKLRSVFDKKAIDKIISVCNSIIAGELNPYGTTGYHDIKEKLLLIYGISERVADRVCLYSYGIKAAFPQSNVIEEQIELFMGCEYETFMEWYEPVVEDFSGLLRQYFLYNKLNPPQEEEIKYGIIR